MTVVEVARETRNGGDDQGQDRDGEGEQQRRPRGGAELARKQGSGSVDYVWRNPATNAVEQKHTLIQRVDDVLLGVGYYTRP